MSWNYRFVEYSEGEKYICLQEVHYNDAGKAMRYADPTIGGNTREEALANLRQALKDAEVQTTLEYKEDSVAYAPGTEAFMALLKNRGLTEEDTTLVPLRNTI